MVKTGEWGIQITAKSREAYRTTSIKYSTAIARYTGQKLFVTNNEIRRIIKENKFNEQELGVVRRSIDREKKHIRGFEFYPFGSRQRRVNTAFKRKGIATQIEIKILKDLMEKFPGHSFWLSKAILPQREKQLKRQQRRTGEMIPIEEEYKKLAAYARKKATEKRKTKQIKPMKKSLPKRRLRK